MKRLLFIFLYVLAALGIAFSVLLFSKWQLINGVFVLIASIFLMPCVCMRILRRSWKFRWQFLVFWFGFLLLGSIDYPATPIHFPSSNNKKQNVPSPTEIVTVSPVIPIPTRGVTVSPTDKPTATPTPTPVKETPFLSVICLDVGQGDATLFCFHGEDGSDRYLMNDGGDRGTSSFVVARLKKLGVERLDAIVCSHYDADHTYGLIGCVEALSDRNTTVFCPDYVADTYTYTSFRNHVENCGLAVVHPQTGDSFSFGECKITFVGPKTYSEKENNNSLAFLLTYQGVTFLFTGDAEGEEERDIVDGGLVGTVDVYHVGHHGSYSASSAYLLNAVKPRYSIISVGANNDYEHPHNVTLNRLQQCGSEVLRTDLRGEIVFTVTSEGLSVSTEK